jgi:hypothetical protein
MWCFRRLEGRQAMVRRPRILRLVGLLFLALLLAPATALAQTATEGNNDSFIFHVNTPTTIATGQEMGSVVVIDDDVVVDGTVNDILWVVNGNATVNGTVDNDVLVINGTLNLAAGSTVKNITLIRSDLSRADGATVTGDISERSELFSFGWGEAIFSFVFWVGVTIVLLLAGLAFAALGGRQLVESGHALTAHPLESFLTALATFILLPILAVIAIITLIGIPLGLVIFMVLMPLLVLLGYIVAGERLGEWLVTVTGARLGRYAAVLIGILALQIVGLIPFVGGLLVALATFFGSGALVYRLYRQRRPQAAAPVVVGEVAKA